MRLGWADPQTKHSVPMIRASVYQPDRSQTWRHTLPWQLFFRLKVLTVLGVCVAKRVLAVCVASVMVVDLARIRSLILFNAELMVWGRTTQRETEDDTCNQQPPPLTTCHFYCTRWFYTTYKLIFDQIWHFLCIFSSNNLIQKNVTEQLRL